jgi:hypothetical protein
MGSAWWTADCGPFWGHNALVRIAPFIAHCDLPVLPGGPPLGGQIMSHDQVEATFMRRGGYEVRGGERVDGAVERFVAAPGRLHPFEARPPLVVLRDQALGSELLEHVARHPLADVHVARAGLDDTQPAVDRGLAGVRPDRPELHAAADLGATEAKEGDTVTLIGQEQDERITAEDIAEWAGTIPYEIVTRLNSHLPRILTA